jgi:site-specific DNA-methyltransferase (adenine-specific)
MNLCQYMTPQWVAEALVERHFSRLDASDHVIEPSCGDGSFLHAIPAFVPAIGVEIDPVLADTARRETGREVLVGDFISIDLPHRPTALIGNPPFVASVVDGFLHRAFELLPEGGRAGFILPAYLFQTAARVAGYADRWSISQELLPRNAFHTRMQTPLLFAIFSKDAKRRLIGFALYREAADVQALPDPYRVLLESSSGSVWKAVCKAALSACGGSGSLKQIYAELEDHRPTRTQFWREKIRQTLRHYSDTFVPIATARYALVGAA